MWLAINLHIKVLHHRLCAIGLILLDLSDQMHETQHCSALRFSVLLLKVTFITASLHLLKHMEAASNLAGAARRQR